MTRFLVITISVARSNRYGNSGGFVVVRSVSAPPSRHACSGVRSEARDMIESQPCEGGN